MNLAKAREFVSELLLAMDGMDRPESEGNVHKDQHKRAYLALHCIADMLDVHVVSRMELSELLVHLRDSTQKIEEHGNFILDLVNRIRGKSKQDSRDGGDV